MYRSRSGYPAGAGTVMATKSELGVVHHTSCRRSPRLSWWPLPTRTRPVWTWRRSSRSPPRRSRRRSRTARHLQEERRGGQSGQSSDRTSCPRSQRWSSSPRPTRRRPVSIWRRTARNRPQRSTPWMKIGLRLKHTERGGGQRPTLTRSRGRKPSGSRWWKRWTNLDTYVVQTSKFKVTLPPISFWIMIKSVNLMK